MKHLVLVTLQTVITSILFISAGYAAPWGVFSTSAEGTALVPSPVPIPESWKRNRANASGPKQSVITKPTPLPSVPHRAAPKQTYRQGAVQKTPVEPIEADRAWGITNVVSEIRVGGFIHDFGPFSRRKEDGADANLEILFHSPDFLDVIWAPKPHIGTSISTTGKTSQVYFGLSYEWDFWDHFMTGFSLGGTYHNGLFNGGHRLNYRKELGCPLLFRESVKLGYRVTDHQTLLLHFDHASNATICSQNEGLESVGVQYGYRF